MREVSEKKGRVRKRYEGEEKGGKKRGKRERRETVRYEVHGRE